MSELVEEAPSLTYDIVSSEMHDFTKEEVNSDGAVLSRYDFTYPASLIAPNDDISLAASIDKDGDTLVVRKNETKTKEGEIIIEQRTFASSYSNGEHHSSTTLDLVGEQVWRGALFLADFILHNHSLFQNANVLELASGVGVTSIVAARFAKSSTITDMDRGDMLSLIEKNVERNKDDISAKIHIKELDFYDFRTIEDITPLLNDVTIILVADVVYHNQLTDAFFDTVLKLMMGKNDKVMYIALEKRYVFTVEDMDTVAPCYDYFLTRLHWLTGQERDILKWSIKEVDTFPQYFTYERTRHLVLWELRAEHI